jgi:hypothetical protein
MALVPYASYATADGEDLLAGVSDPDHRSGSTQRVCQLPESGIYYGGARPQGTVCCRTARDEEKKLYVELH